jgi:hypothetical protein
VNLFEKAKQNRAIEALLMESFVDTDTYDWQPDESVYQSYHYKPDNASAEDIAPNPDDGESPPADTEFENGEEATQPEDNTPEYD